MSAEKFLYSPVTAVYCLYCSKSGVSHTAVLLWNMEFKFTVITLYSSLHCCPTVVCSMIWRAECGNSGTLTEAVAVGLLYT